MSLSSNKCKSGFTLVEILLATMILGVSIMPIFTSITLCLKTMNAARDFQDVRWAFSIAALQYPLPDASIVEKIEDLVVDPPEEVCDGFVFSRTVDEKVIDENVAGSDDGLYVVRSRISWGKEEDETFLEQVRYFWKEGLGEYKP